MRRAEFAAWVRARRHVASRSELAEVGVSAGTIAGRVKEGEWQRLHSGVYLLSPSNPSWEQRLRGAWKWARGRAVFSHQTAAYLHGLRADLPQVIEMSAPSSSGIRTATGCAVYRRRVDVTSVGEPARTTLEETVVDLIASAGSESEVLEILMKAVQKQMDLERFLTRLNTRRKVRHRTFVVRLTGIAAEGVESHLELAYRRKVERAHGLPDFRRQKWERVRGRWIRSDCWNEEYRVRIELDGELAHPGRATDADLMRDNDVQLALDEITLRYRWRQVWLTPCVVAGQVARALQLRGWHGQLKPCSPTCDARRVLAELSAHTA